MIPATVDDGLGPHALAYAARGLEVFPLNANKTPKTTHGWKEATTDRAQIEGWWGRWPAALIGCRVPRDLVLLDIDPRHGGVETWKLIKELWCPALTRAHRSGRGDGGGHTWWLRPSDKLSVRKLDDWAREQGTGQAVSETRWVSGIDVLHWDHRYTILPPSPHPDTGAPYVWVPGRDLGHPALAMPAELAALISADEEPPTPPPTPRLVDEDSIADWYSGTHACGETLQRHGWRVVAGDGVQEGSRWRHPEATAAYSATIRHRCLFVYSPNTPFEVTEPGRPQGYTPFSTFALLDHGDDQSAAGRAARELRDGPVERLDPADLLGPRQAQKADEDDESDEDDQQAPEPLPWPELAPAALHGPLGRIVEQLTPHTEADPVGVLASLLVYFGAAVGPGPHFRLSGNSHSARINVVVVGDSARARKGSAEGMARWIMRTADPAIASDRRANGLNSGEGLIEAVRDARWGKDKSGNDVLVDAGVDDKRLMLFEPEFAGRLLTAIKRSGSTISALLRMAWDDGNLQTMSRNPLRATGAHICVLGNAVIDELLTQVTASDMAGGLLNRFLFVAVRSGRRLPFGGELDDQAVEEMARPLREVLARARVRSRLPWGKSCRESWPGAYDALMDDAPDGPMGHLTARGPVQVQRLALIYALAEGAASIEVDHLESAISFWGFCRDSAELILSGDCSGALTGDPDGDRMLKLLVESERAWGMKELARELGWSGSKVVAVRGRLARLQLVRVGPVKGESGRPRMVVMSL